MESLGYRLNGKQRHKQPKGFNPVGLIDWRVLLLLGVWWTVLPFTGVSASEEEDGGIRQHADFEFEAFIKHSDITDGNGPFDANNDPGNDAGDSNGIVRSWDTVTYPLKITINPKKEDMLQQIVLRISGTLENGVTDGRVNAKFGVGGTEDIPNETIHFVQNYTVEQTGNSIMIPIALEVQGAKHGVELTPDIQVQVMSVGGRSIEADKVIERFDTLPAVTVSSKVSIKPYVGTGLAGQGLAYFPYEALTGNPNNKENMHAFAVSWGVTALPGRTSIKGATFPDPQGKINYEVKLSGHVDWDSPAKREVFDFESRDTTMTLIDQRPISNTAASIGAMNTLLDGMPYSFNRSGRYSAAMSQLPDLKQSTIERYGHHMVWDSGTWEVDAPNVAKSSVTYSGYNTNYLIGSTFPRNRADGYTGSFLYGVNDRIFSSNSFLVMMANEYRIGGPNNQAGRANNVNYRADVKLISYTDEFGVDVPFTQQTSAAVSFTERNNPSGAMSVQQTLAAHPSGAQLGTPVIGNAAVSKGDASVIIGENVRMNGYFLHSVPLAGGYTTVHRWNPDAFELTRAFATTAETNLYNVGYYNNQLATVARDYTKQKVSFGVAKFTDFEFKSFTSKARDDYTWYTSFDEASRAGVVSAVKNDVRAFIPPSHKSWNIPLRVKHENIGVGAETKNGTANIAVTNAYGYMDAERTRETDVSANRAYHNPAIWDDNGNMLQKQSPSGSSVNFETLAVTPAQMASVLTSDKGTYYNSESIKWTARSSIVLPSSGVPDSLDAGIEVRHILPEGLDYKTGTGNVGGVATEPEITQNEDKTKTLTWTTLVSNSNRSIPTIVFETTINPFALSATGVQSGVTVTSVISSELDQRKEHLRTSSRQVTILKVGMVGIYESIDKLYGGKNTAFKLTLSPYTTIEDEYGVTGLTVLPVSGDGLGSKYSGTARISDMALNVDRQDDDAVRIFVNNAPVYSNRPHEVDVTRDGWREYSGEPEALTGAVSVLFQVDGKMTNRDNIQLHVTVQTDDNEFGDHYMNETVINSATDYRLSPVSNRVRYLIRADLELALERVRIYTDAAENGLPVSVRLRQTILDAESVKDQDITFGIYDADGDKVAEKTFKQTQLQRENELVIPASELSDGLQETYDVRIEGFDDMLIWVKDGDGSLDAEGYAAENVTLTNADRNASGVASFTGVVMTEREMGRELVAYKETLTVNKINQPRVKAGYGFPFTATVTYHNELLGDVLNRTDALGESEATLAVDHELLDRTLEYYDADSPKNEIPLLRESDTTVPNTVVMNYRIPLMYLEQGTGDTYSSRQRENGDIAGLALDAGYKLYVPIWLDGLGKYEAGFTSDSPIGSHRVSFDMMNEVDVYAYMFSYTDSETFEDDSLLVYPAKPSEMPDFE